MKQGVRWKERAVNETILEYVHQLALEYRIAMKKTSYMYQTLDPDYGGDEESCQESSLEANDESEPFELDEKHDEEIFKETHDSKRNGLRK